MADNLHTVTVEFDAAGGFPRLAFKCLAESASDPACHMVCPESECEEGCHYPDEHVRENIGYCNVVEWLDNSDADECILGSETAVTVPIAYEWHGEGVDWKFDEAAS